MAISTPTIGTVSINTSASTTLLVPYPSGLTSSHYMVLGVTLNSAVATGVTVPTGWTGVFQNSNTSGTNSPAVLLAIKQATGFEIGNLPVTTASAKSWGQIIAATGVDLTTPQDVTRTIGDVTSSAFNVGIGTLTPTRSGCLLVYLAGHNSGNDTATAPAGFTETGDNTGTGGWSGTMGYQIYNSTAATGAVTVVFNGSAKGLGVMLALRPASTVVANSGAFLMFAG